VSGIITDINNQPVSNASVTAGTSQPIPMQMEDLNLRMYK
jgi:hypothetical protein